MLSPIREAFRTNVRGLLDLPEKEMLKDIKFTY